MVGGDEVIRVEALRLKLVTGRSASSSSLNSGDGGSSAMVEPSEMKDRCEGWLEGKRACLVCLIGDDSGRACVFFQLTWRAPFARVRLPVTAPDGAKACTSEGLALLFLKLPPERGRSSLNIGSVIGEEARPLLECSRLEVVEAVSEIVSLLLEAGLFLLSRSST